jgi:hypothetical protein
VAAGRIAISTGSEIIGKLCGLGAFAFEPPPRLKQLATNQENFRTEYQQICGDVQHFVNGLCAIETEILLKAGVKYEVADSLVEEAIAVRNAIVTMRLEPDLIFDNVCRLRDDACDIAKRLHEIPLKKAESLKFKKKAKKVAARIGGVLVVFANAGSIAASLGLSAPGAAVSGAIGGGLVGAAVVVD